MAGELIGLLRLSCLKNIIKSTIASKEFQDNWLKTFRRECLVLDNNEFWKYLFTLCRSLYAPMRILCLTDQQIPAMDKLHYYVLQTDKLLPKYLKIAEDDSFRILEMDRTYPAMSFMASMTDAYSNESDDDNNDDDDDGDDDADDEDDNGDDDDDNEVNNSGDDLANSFDDDPILQQNPQATLHQLDADKNLSYIR